MKYRTHFITLTSALLILLFTYTGVSKLIDYKNFKIQLGQSPLLTTFATDLAWSVPTLELVIAALLVMQFTRMTGLYSAFALMVLFSIYIWAITRYSEYIPCSCGGVIQNLSWNQHLVFNLFFVGITGLSILISRENFNNNPGSFK